MKNILKLFVVCTILFSGYNMLFADTVVYKNYPLTVGSGDTLWDIASRHAEKDEDVREVMYRIAEANNLKSKTLHTGQVLQIPLRVTPEDVMVAAR